MGALAGDTGARVPRGRSRDARYSRQANFANQNRGRSVKHDAENRLSDCFVFVLAGFSAAGFVLPPVNAVASVLEPHSFIASTLTIDVGYVYTS